MILLLVTSPKVKKLLSNRKAQNLPELPPSFKIYKPENHYVLPSAPESEYPCHVPLNVTPCGPILLPVTPVSEADPELCSWLERRPTILINLGSLVRMDETMTQKFAAGLKIVLDKIPEVQVLWKIKKFGGMIISSQADTKNSPQEKGLTHDSLDAIWSEIRSGRVKVLEWVSVDPLALLQSGKVVCSVHHGGSNSFHEALRYLLPSFPSNTANTK
jgi:UDP:flavonoid glycosyltransferase YjiC (YdhE family)